MIKFSPHLVERAAALLRDDTGSNSKVGAVPLLSELQSPSEPVVRSAADKVTAAPIAASRALSFPEAVRVDFPTMLRAGLSVAGTQRSRIGEEYRVTVDRLFRGLLTARKDPQLACLMMVTSAKPGEGKTFSALNIATTLAQNKLGQVVLIDMDNKPNSLSGQFGLIDAPGLLNLAADPALHVDDLLVRTAVDGLFCLPVGKASIRSIDNVIQPITAAAEQITKRLANHILVVDCAPCLSSSDPIALAPLATQIVLVVEAEHTQRNEINSSLDLLSACPNVMLMLNKTQLTTAATFGAHYYHYAHDPRP